VKIEKNGRDFYLQQSKRLDDEGRELFIKLAEDEKQHIDDFKNLYDQIDSNYPAYDDQLAVKYLEALADSRVFIENEITDMIEDAKSPEKIINYAIMLEKESLIFYYGIKDSIRSSARGIIDSIISQEKQHINRLSSFKT